MKVLFWIMVAFVVLFAIVAILLVTHKEYILFNLIDDCFSEFGYRTEPCHKACMYNCTTCTKNCRLHQVSLDIDKKFVG